MRENLLMSLLGLIIFSSSCSSTLQITNSTAKSTDIASTGVYHRPVVADLSVREKKIEAEVISDSYDDVLGDLKQKAIVKALKKVNGDVLVEPKYQIVKAGNRKTVTVTGYPATYNNFRNATFEDMDLILVENQNSMDIQEIKDQKDDVSSGKALLWVLVGLGVVSGLTLLF